MSLRSLLCRFMGGHLPSPIALPTGQSSSIVSECLRCHSPLVRWSPSQKTSSLFGVLTIDNLMLDRDQSTALRAAWARASGEPTWHFQKAPDTESASAPSGASR